MKKKSYSRSKAFLLTIKFTVLGITWQLTLRLSLAVQLQLFSVIKERRGISVTLKTINNSVRTNWHVPQLPEGHASAINKKNKWAFHIQCDLKIYISRIWISLLLSLMQWTILYASDWCSCWYANCTDINNHFKPNRRNMKTKT